MSQESQIGIRKTSWHGRLTRYVFGEYHIEDTPSICPYFWSVIASVIIAPFKYFGEKIDDWGYGFHVLVGISMLNFFVGIVFVPKLIILLGLLLVSVYVLAWIALQLANDYEKRHPYKPKKNRKDPKPPKPKKKYWWLEWLKAKKDKVCPMIYQIEEEKDAVIVGYSKDLVGEFPEERLARLMEERIEWLEKYGDNVFDKRYVKDMVQELKKLLEDSKK